MGSLYFPSLYYDALDVLRYDYHKNQKQSLLLAFRKRRKRERERDGGSKEGHLMTQQNIVEKQIGKNDRYQQQTNKFLFFLQNSCLLFGGGKGFFFRNFDLL